MTFDKNTKIAVIITAAGSSSRMGGGKKKEYLPLKRGTVLSNSAEKFLETLNCYALIITFPEGGKKNIEKALFDTENIACLLNKNNTKLILTQGGSTRQKSVFNALKAAALITLPPNIVLIHDGARPFLTSNIIIQAVNETLKYKAAVPVISPSDTQKLTDKNGFIRKHLKRSETVSVQTPQGFDFLSLFEAHKKAALFKEEYTDDSEIWAKYISPVKTFAGDISNKKITFLHDYENFMNKKSNIRIGLGYDIHRLTEGRRFLLGGVEIPFEKGEEAHSDGDVLLHAVTDSLLGACGLGDIGSFFPPEDNKWKNANSAVLLKTVYEKIKSINWSLVNLDCVIKLEKPKFLPFRNQIINSIANILDVEPSCIFVKAKTAEKMDSVGKGEAVEVYANCLLEYIQ